MRTRIFFHSLQNFSCLCSEIRADRVFRRIFHMWAERASYSSGTDPCLGHTSQPRSSSQVPVMKQNWLSMQQGKFYYWPRHGLSCSRRIVPRRCQHLPSLQRPQGLSARPQDDESLHPGKPSSLWVSQGTNGSSSTPQLVPFNPGFLQQ